MARYLLQIKKTGHRPLIVFDDHNAEYVLQKRAFETDLHNPTRWIGALYSFVQWRKLRRYEAMICKLADRVIAVSEADKEAIERLVPGLKVIAVPNGVDTEYYNDKIPMTKSQLGNCPLVFTGKMDFRPNVDAVIWFCREVLPLVQCDFPSVHFFIVGQSPNRRVISLARNPAVTVTGYVKDVRPYIAGALVYVLPLRMGGGTRLKLLEAMAMGKAIVSTSLGCEGFDATYGRELLVADDAEEFAHLVVELLRDAQRRERLGKEARRFAERYDWRNIVPKMERVYG
jgi:glycosyltransferase involved in cell wall biosynthesis